MKRPIRHHERPIQSLPLGSSLSLSKAWRGVVPIVHVDDMDAFRATYGEWRRKHQDAVCLFEYLGAFIDPEETVAEDV